MDVLINIYLNALIFFRAQNRTAIYICFDKFSIRRNTGDFMGFFDKLFGKNKSDKEQDNGFSFAVHCPKCGTEIKEVTGTCPTCGYRYKM